jgi:hypothetical protein
LPPAVVFVHHVVDEPANHSRTSSSAHARTSTPVVAADQRRPGGVGDVDRRRDEGADASTADRSPNRDRDPACGATATPRRVHPTERPSP